MKEQQLDIKLVRRKRKEGRMLEQLHGRMLLRRTDRESEMKEQQLGMKPVRRKMTGFHGCIKAVLRCEMEQIN